VSGTSYTFSVYLKAAEITRVTLQIGSVFFPQTLTNFNLSSGTVASGTGTITAVGNGWYRCSNTATATSTGSGEFFVELTDASGNRQYVGNGSNGVFLWGCQVEAGAFPTSYIPTVAATATRNADVASMTGTNFSSWFNNAEGTLYSESIVARQVSAGGTGVFTISDGTTNNQHRILYRGTGATQSATVTNNTIAADLTPTGVLSANAVAKIAYGYKTDDFAASGNGSAAVTDTGGTLPVVNQTSIGLQTNYLNGTIKKLSFYPVRLSNDQLQALTR
jgi:hypothetical protein